MLTMVARLGVPVETFDYQAVRVGCSRPGARQLKRWADVNAQDRDDF